MSKQKDFDTFLSNIEPSGSTVQYVSNVQNNLRDYLKNHTTYKEVYDDSFLSGSYAKHTSIRPSNSDNKRDVDIIVVTTHDSNDNSKDVIEELKYALLQSKTYDTAMSQHHSVGVEMSKVSVDIVPVILDVDDDQLCYVGDSVTGNWVKTDPKGHKTWSTQVNQDNNSAYKPLVKIFKWWRRTNCPKDVKYPKGITLEKLVADNLGDSSASTEVFLIETMENIVSAYRETYADRGIVPWLEDPSDKIQGNNLLDGYSVSDFSAFIYKLDEHLKLLNDKGTENVIWRKILGTEFPKDSQAKSAYNLIVCEKASHRQKMMWPFARGGAVLVGVKVIDPYGNTIEYENNGEPLEKNCSLEFKALTGVKRPYRVMWQITNTGDEARNAGCLRGNFEESDLGQNGKHEVTAYAGSHSIQCFVIKGAVCVAKSNSFIINIK